MSARHACPEFEEQLSLLVDGRLSGARAEALGRHLDDCGACGDFAKDLQALRTSIGELALPQPRSDALWTGLAARLADNQAAGGVVDHGSPLRGRRRDALLAAASFIVGLALWHAWPMISAIGSPSAAAPAAAPPIALTVGEFVGEVAASDSPELFWSRYRAIDALPERVADALDFSPTVLNELPGGYRLRSIKLLKDACCYTLHLRYASADAVLDVFQCHDDHPIEFGDATARRGRRDGVSFTDLQWQGAPVRGRVLMRDDVNIVVIGDLEPAAADILTRELANASD